MTDNLTESMAVWPWAAWLVLAALCFAAELFRRDRWAEGGILGCVLAAAIAVVVPHLPALHFLGFALGTVASLALARPWQPDAEPDADHAGH